MPCLPWAAGPQQTLCRSESSKEGRGGKKTGMGVGEGQAGPSLADRAHPAAPQVWACFCMRWGRGVIQAVDAHVKVSSIIHGHLEELPACFRQAGGFTQRAACGPSGWTPEGPWVIPSRKGGSLGRTKTPQAVPDSVGQGGEGPAQPLSLLLRGCKALGAPHQGADTTCGSGFIRKGAGDRADGQGLPRESGVGFGFHGEEPQGLGGW